MPAWASPVRAGVDDEALPVLHVVDAAGADRLVVQVVLGRAEEDARITHDVFIKHVKVFLLSPWKSIARVMPSGSSIGHERRQT